MFRVKICGITNVEDAIVAVEAGADAIGLNFYEKSPRCVSAECAANVAHALSDSPAWRVGVFVNATRIYIDAIADRARLSAIQLHGDEAPQFVAQLAKPRPASMGVSPGYWVIWARRVVAEGVEKISRDLDSARLSGRGPAAILVDALTPGRYGGTGEKISWVGMVDHRQWLGDTPLILAGGLTPDNVAEAIRIVRPAAVDVASGVESSPGKKDSVKVRDFVANALGAFEGLGGT
jgi:phosphoribosylanthranilate isomerase